MSLNVATQIFDKNTTSLPAGRKTKAWCKCLALIKSDFCGCNGSLALGLRILPNSADFEGKLELETDSFSAGFSKEYSQILLAPQLKRLCTIVSCSGTQTAPEPALAHLIWLTWRPRDRCTEQQSEHSRMPLLMDAHSGPGVPQSPHEDRGCCLMAEELLLDVCDKIFLVNIAIASSRPSKNLTSWTVTYAFQIFRRYFFPKSATCVPIDSSVLPLIPIGLHTVCLQNIQLIVLNIVNSLNGAKSRVFDKFRIIVIENSVTWFCHFSSLWFVFLSDKDRILCQPFPCLSSAWKLIQ